VYVTAAQVSLIGLRVCHSSTDELDWSVCLDILIQFTAIMWLKEFVSLSGPAMLAFVSGILSAILPCLSYDDETRISILEQCHVCVIVRLPSVF